MSGHREARMSDFKSKRNMGGSKLLSSYQSELFFQVHFSFDLGDPSFREVYQGGITSSGILVQVSLVKPYNRGAVLEKIVCGDGTFIKRPLVVRIFCQCMFKCLQRFLVCSKAGVSNSQT